MGKRQIRLETIAMQQSMGEGTSHAERELSVLESLLSEKGVTFVDAPKIRLKNTRHGSYTTYYDVRGVQPRIMMLRHEEARFHKARVLDIGCNSGVLSAAIADYFHVINAGS